MSKLAIGTANFGMNYGYINSPGKINANIIKQILDLAYQYNIDTIDTAQAYGDSEKVLGNYLKTNTDKNFKIITKLNTTENPKALISQSFINLHQEKLYGILIHDFSYLKANPSLIELLSEYKKRNQIEKIGVSLYYPEELEFLLNSNIDFDLIQIAYSVFDRRFENYFPILYKKNIEINVRSAFLQGLFFRNPDELGPHFNKVKDKLRNLQQLSKNTGLSISSLCLNYVYANKYISKIVIGLENADNFLKNLKVLSEKDIVINHIDHLNEFLENDINILFPHYWKV